MQLIKTGLSSRWQACKGSNARGQGQYGQGLLCGWAVAVLAVILFHLQPILRHLNFRLTDRRTDAQ